MTLVVDTTFVVNNKQYSHAFEVEDDSFSIVDEDGKVILFIDHNARVFDENKVEIGKFKLRSIDQRGLFADMWFFVDRNGAETVYNSDLLKAEVEFAKRYIAAGGLIKPEVKQDVKISSKGINDPEVLTIANIILLLGMTRKEFIKLRYNTEAKVQFPQPDGQYALASGAAYYWKKETLLTYFNSASSSVTLDEINNRLQEIVSQNQTNYSYRIV